MIQELYRRKICKEFLKNYSDEAIPKVIPKVFEIGVLTLLEGFKTLNFSIEELDDILNAFYNKVNNGSFSNLLVSKSKQFPEKDASKSQIIYNNQKANETVNFQDTKNYIQNNKQPFLQNIIYNSDEPEPNSNNFRNTNEDFVRCASPKQMSPLKNSGSDAFKTVNNYGIRSPNRSIKRLDSPNLNYSNSFNNSRNFSSQNFHPMNTQSTNFYDKNYVPYQQRTLRNKQLYNTTNKNPIYPDWWWNQKPDRNDSSDDDHHPRKNYFIKKDVEKRLKNNRSLGRLIALGKKNYRDAKSPRGLSNSNSKNYLSPYRGTNKNKYNSNNNMNDNNRDDIQNNNIKQNYFKINKNENALKTETTNNINMQNNDNNLKNQRKMSKTTTKTISHGNKIVYKDGELSVIKDGIKTTQNIVVD